MQPENQTMADVDSSDWALHDLAVSVAALGVPDDGIRRNLGLLGFTGEEVPDGLPAASARPADFHRLASRVGTWPYEGRAELVEGLAYCAFLVEGAYPVGTDFMSDCVLIVPDMEDPIEFAVVHSIDSTQNPKDSERALVQVSLYQRGSHSKGFGNRELVPARLSRDGRTLAPSCQGAAAIGPPGARHFCEPMAQEGGDLTQVGAVELCRDATVLDQVCKGWSQCCETQWEPRGSEHYREPLQPLPMVRAWAQGLGADLVPGLLLSGGAS